jgi:hypothetical protein
MRRLGWLLSLLLLLWACDDGAPNPVAMDAGGDPPTDAAAPIPDAQPDAAVVDPDVGVPDLGQDAVVPDAGTPDVGPDAAALDAAVPDAAVPDAAVPDAALPDAAVVDAEPPAPLTLEIEQPLDGTLLNQSPVRVQGAAGGEGVRVSVNGLEAPVEGGRFTVDVPLQEGANALVATATDALGAMTDGRVNVTLDTIAPALVIAEPADGAVVNATPIRVAGTLDDPTATLTLNGAAVPVAEGAFVIEAQALLAGENALVFVATDLATNATEVVVQVTLDAAAPTLTVSEPTQNAIIDGRRVTVRGETEPGTAITVDDVAAVVDDAGAFSAEVVVEADGAHAITVVARSAVGAEAQVVRTVTFDTRAPVVRISRPAAGVLLNRSRLIVEGTVDEPVEAVEVNGVQAEITNLSYRAENVPVGEGQAEIVARATDRAGHVGEARLVVEVDSVAPGVEIIEPAEGLKIRADSVNVRGRVLEPDVASVEVNGVLVELEAGLEFSVDNIPLVEGRNLITAVAIDGNGNAGLAQREVQRDTLAPSIRIETPRQGQILTTDTVDVAGMCNDLTTGVTINQDDMRIWVDGVEAEVHNRTFVVPDHRLLPGPNQIVVEAVDTAGNRTVETIEVTVSQAAGQRLMPVSGMGQSAALGERLAEPLSVRLVDGQGDPVANRPVDFVVTRGDGEVVDDPRRGRTLVVLTNDHGFAQLYFEPGPRTGVGSHRVTASAAGFMGEVDFCASVSIGAAVRIVAAGGRTQVGTINQALVEPLLAFVTDDEGNPVPGVAVQFIVDRGEGHFGDGNEVAHGRTNAEGLVSATYTVGPDGGMHSQIIVAHIVGLEDGDQKAVFIADALIPGDRDDTRMLGYILDGTDQPIVGATAWIRLPQGPILAAVTDRQGAFVIDRVPLGAVRLEVDGSTGVGGPWPQLTFDLVMVAGVDNILPRPIYLPEINPETSVEVGGPDDVIMHMPGVEGAEITIYGDSVTCPEGAERCTLTWTQVRTSRIPSDAPLGSSLRWVATLQPPNIPFDPPARICLPNRTGAPGHQSQMFSFDHDLGDWVGIGTATISDDGKQICTDAGFGLFKSGWHGPPPDDDDDDDKCASDCKSFNPCQTGRCVDGSCKYEPKGDGAACDDGSGCAAKVCERGACRLVTDPPGNVGDDCPKNDHCKEGETCDASGNCSGGAPVDCEFENFENDDGCKRYWCEPDTGCQEEPLPDDTACDEPSGAPEIDECSKWACQGGACGSIADESKDEKECEKPEGAADCEKYQCNFGLCEPLDDPCEAENDANENPCTEFTCDRDVNRSPNCIEVAAEEEGECDGGNGEDDDDDECGRYYCDDWVYRLDGSRSYRQALPECVTHGDNTDGDSCAVDDGDAPECGECKAGECVQKTFEYSGWSVDLPLTQLDFIRTKLVRYTRPFLLVDRFFTVPLSTGLSTKARDCCKEEGGSLQHSDAQHYGGEGTMSGHLSTKVTLTGASPWGWATARPLKINVGPVDLDVSIRVGITWSGTVGFGGSFNFGVDECSDPRGSCFDVGLDLSMILDLQAGLSVAACQANSDLPDPDADTGDGDGDIVDNRIGSTHGLADPTATGGGGRPIATPNYCLTVFGRDYCFGGLLHNLCGNITLTPAGFQTGADGRFEYVTGVEGGECSREEGFGFRGCFHGVKFTMRLNLVITSFEWTPQIMDPVPLGEGDCSR